MPVVIDPSRKPRPDIPNTRLHPHPLRLEPEFEVGENLITKFRMGTMCIKGFGTIPPKGTAKILAVGFKEYTVRCNWDGTEIKAEFRHTHENFRKLEPDLMVALCQ
jgi:hypothetical protein